jgi:AGCS family alanine or glycine:cation symporter
MFAVLSICNKLFWSYFISFFIIFCSLYLTFYYKFFQLLRYGKVYVIFFKLYKQKSRTISSRGIDTIKIFFTALSGCIGIGNIASISIAVQIGGPGVIIWMWVTAFLGMSLKYSEIFLGMKYRIKLLNSYRGGPMFFFYKKLFRIVEKSLYFVLYVCVFMVLKFMYLLLSEILFQLIQEYPEVI